MADLMQAQSTAGHQVRALVHHHQKHIASAIDDRQEGQIHRVKIYGNLLFVPIAPAFGKHLTGLVQAFQPDVIHMHMPNLSCFWALLSKVTKRIPWIIHWHSDVIGASPDWRLKLLYPVYRLAERALLQRAKSIIVTSPPYLASSQPLAPFKSKCRVIQLGIKDNDMPISIQTQNSEILRLVCIGRLTYYKGHEVLLRAIKKLTLEQTNVSLDIIGKGELERHLDQMTTQLGIESQIKIRGAVSAKALNDALNDCDVLCLPSIERTEAFGVVLLEAMRASKPCIVTDVPGSGMSWVVESGKTGVVVKAGDEHSLANAIAKLAKNKPRLRQMGVEARNRFNHLFTIEQVVEQIDQAYREAIDLK